MRACVAGLAVLLAEGEDAMDWETEFYGEHEESVTDGAAIRTRATELYSLTRIQAWDLFDGINTLDQIRVMGARFWPADQSACRPADGAADGPTAQQ